MGTAKPFLEGSAKEEFTQCGVWSELEGAGYIQGAQVQVLVLPLTGEKVPSKSARGVRWPCRTACSLFSTRYPSPGSDPKGLFSWVVGVRCLSLCIK